MIKILLSLALFVMTIWAIISVVSSNEGVATKVIWIVVILLLPIIGLVAWFFLGPRAT